MEFVWFIGLAFFTMIIFIASTRSEFDSLRGEEERSLLKDLGAMITNELVTASTVEDGYIRVIIIPSKLDGINYSIQIINQVLLVSTDDFEYVSYLPLISGDFKKGNNTIKKTDGLIYLN